MIHTPPTQLHPDEPPLEGALDRQRAESMADEGGAAGAVRDMEEQLGAAEDEYAETPAAPTTPPRRLLSPLALGTARAVAKVIARVRRAAGRRAAARSTDSTH